jgi:hypothetical protein
MAPFMAMSMRKGNAEALTRLKQRLESAPSADSLGLADAAGSSDGA